MKQFHKEGCRADNPILDKGKWCFRPRCHLALSLVGKSRGNSDRCICILHDMDYNICEVGLAMLVRLLYSWQGLELAPSPDQAMQPATWLKTSLTPTRQGSFNAGQKISQPAWKRSFRLKPSLSSCLPVAWIIGESQFSRLFLLPPIAWILASSPINTTLTSFLDENHLCSEGRMSFGCRKTTED